MAIKVDRPADSFGDGIVVYVAKSIEEVDQARAGLTAAGIPVDLPEAAVQALFEAGRDSLPIRVAPGAFKKAQDVIDELFPPPLLELPPLDDEEPAEAGASGAAPGGSSGGSGGGGGGGGGGGRAGPQLDRAVLETSRSTGELSPKKLESSSLKLIAISGGSIFLPVIGLLFAIFGLAGGVWLLRRTGPGKARTRTWIAIGLGSLAICAHVGMLAYLAQSEGWF